MEIIFLIVEILAVDRLAFTRVDTPPAFGNPIALLLVAEGRVDRPSTAMLVGFGVGYSWGATLLRNPMA